jgi:hypothetical protein
VNLQVDTDYCPENSPSNRCVTEGVITIVECFNIHKDSQLQSSFDPHVIP